MKLTIIILLSTSVTAIIREVTYAPWAVLITITNTDEELSCSGSIIEKRFVLTAAHCLHPEKMQNITVSTSLIEHNYSVVECSIHPEYRTKRSAPHDIAVLKTATEIEFYDKVQKIEVEFRKIVGNLHARRYGYSPDRSDYFCDPSFRLKFVDATMKVCESSLICSQMSDSDGIICGDDGGSLVFCRDFNAFIKCRLIGVARSHSGGKDFFVSTQNNHGFITTSLSNTGFVPIVSSAAPDSTVSERFAPRLSFLAMLLISY